MAIEEEEALQMNIERLTSPLKLKRISLAGRRRARRSPRLRLNGSLKTGASSMSG